MNKEIQGIISEVLVKTRNITADGGILVAVSGGPDSVALTWICDGIPDIKRRMRIAYIHHGLRKNADIEERFVKSLARKLGIPFHCRKIKVKKTKKMSIEEIARIKRYRALIQIAKQTNCTILLTAHTMDDQAETVVLNLLTGSGLKGLCGMQTISQIDKNLWLVRPMLSITKKDILSYLEKRGIEYMLDESNIDTKYKRNFIRYKIMPLLEKINAGAKKNIFRASRILSDDFDYIDSETKKIIQKIVSKNKDHFQFPLKAFLKLHTCLQRFFIRDIIMEFCNIVYPPDFATIEQIRTSISLEKNLFVKKAGVFIICENDTVSISKKDNSRKVFLFKPVIINVPGITEIPEINLRVSTSYKKFTKRFLKNTNKLVAYINPDRIQDRLVLKVPETQSCFIPLGMKENVKFKKYWKTHKKQIEIVVGFPAVIEDGGKIVWVVGGHISEDYAVGKEGRVLEIKITKQ